MKELQNKLNELLSAYQVAYFNARAAHWMIKGHNFFELHKVFETVYTDATDKIDEIAERMLTLGMQPHLLVSEMLSGSKVKEKASGGEETECVKCLLDDLNSLNGIEKEIVKLAETVGDVVTADQMTGYMREQQKTSWMLYQFQSKKSKVE